jgi:hypothetical protein
MSAALRGVDRGSDHDFHVIEVRHGNESYLRETDKAGASFAAVVEDILAGQVENVIGVYSFNPIEGWARDVSEDVARAVASKAAREDRAITDSTRAFIQDHAGFAVARGLQLVNKEFVT